MTNLEQQVREALDDVLQMFYCFDTRDEFLDSERLLVAAVARALEAGRRCVVELAAQREDIGNIVLGAMLAALRREAPDA